MKHYRTLNDGELVMAGDEFWGIDRSWIPATEIGKKVTSYTHKMYRRPIADDVKEQRIQNWTAKIDRIVGNYKKLSAVCDEAYGVGTLDRDGKLSTAIWQSYDLMMDFIDKHEWLEWFIFDNDCGDSAMEAGFDDVVNSVKTSRDLAKLIVEDEDRADR